MYPLIRRYLRRVDVVYLLLCAACSAISIAVLMSIGQTQLGSNNKASVQLIASLLGLMLAVVFSTADYHALARAWPLHGVVAWGLVLPTSRSWTGAARPSASALAKPSGMARTAFATRVSVMRSTSAPAATSLTWSKYVEFTKAATRLRDSSDLSRSRTARRTCRTSKLMA